MQKAQLQQMHEKQYQKVEENTKKVMEGEELNKVVKEEQNKFNNYANSRLMHWDEEKKPVVKLALKKIA